MSCLVADLMQMHKLNDRLHCELGIDKISQSMDRLFLDTIKPVSDTILLK
jgi:hypothetical protein